jgi:hypothetical protein
MMANTSSWIDLSAARRRLVEIDEELVDIRNERRLIELVLGQASLSTAPRPPGRMPPGPVNVQPAARIVKGVRFHIPMADLVVKALRHAPPTGSTIAEIMRHIAVKHPDRVTDPRISATISSAIAKARTTRNPRIKILKRGSKGEPSRYAAL